MMTLLYINTADNQKFPKGRPCFRSFFPLITSLVKIYSLKTFPAALWLLRGVLSKNIEKARKGEATAAACPPVHNNILHVGGGVARQQFLFRTNSKWATIFKKLIPVFIHAMNLALFYAVPSS